MDALITRKRSVKKAGDKKSVVPQELSDFVIQFLEDHKALDMVVIPLEGKSSLADYLVVASGSSQRHIRSMAEGLASSLKTAHGLLAALEGAPQCDWVLLDASSVIVHLFRPEVRAFYNLEKIWSSPPVNDVGMSCL